MAVFEYTAVAFDREGHVETGRIVARDRIDAFDKLKRHNLKLQKLKKVEGLAAFISKMTADIR